MAFKTADLCDAHDHARVLDLPLREVTRSNPARTTVYSSNSGVWPGSIHPPGLRMCAMLSARVSLFTRPTYSSISFGLLPAAVIRVGAAISRGMPSASHPRGAPARARSGAQAAGGFRRRSPLKPGAASPSGSGFSPCAAR